VVTPSGRIASLEFGVPEREPWRALWRTYTAVGLPAAGRLISREWFEVGRFLSRSIPDLYVRHPLEGMPAMWREAGIEAVTVRRMSFGAGVVMWGTRAGARG